MSMKFTKAEQPDADMAIIAKGRKYLYVHKQNLSFFSAYFRKMIQSWDDEAPEHSIDGLPAIMLSETRSLIIRNLEYFYPSFTGTLDHEKERDAEDLMELLMFIDKHSVAPVVCRVLVDALSKYLTGDDAYHRDWMVLFKEDTPTFLIPFREKNFTEAAKGAPWDRKDASDILPLTTRYLATFLHLA